MNCPSNTIHAVLRVNGQVGLSPTSFLIDSGATISVIRHDALTEGVPIMEREASVTAIRAN